MTSAAKSYSPVLRLSLLLRVVKPERIFRFVAFCVIVALTFLPLLNIIFIVATTGANNISNDYLGYMGMIDAILSGTYDWRTYFRDTFVAGAHSIALPFLVRMAIIKFANWNMYAELYLGIGVSIVKLVLLHDALSRMLRDRIHWLLWPMLSGLIFSTSQINVYAYGDTTLTIGLSQFGLVLAVWGLVRFPGRWVAILLLITGGFLATFSGAGGPLVWPVAFLGLLLLGFRNPRHYLAWLVGSVLAATFYGLLMLQGSSGSTRGSLDLFNERFIILALGWPFTQYFLQPVALRAGAIGVALFLTGLVPLWMLWRQSALKLAAPALMIIAYSLGNLWLISAYRGVLGLAPWYTSHFMLFWIGLLGLVYVVFVRAGQRSNVSSSTSPALMVLSRSWCTAVILSIVILYATSNLTYTDKAYYLFSRSPASASCLLHYRSAPTYCEQYVFQWGVGRFELLARLAEPLERFRLSVFAPHQEWSLQGDFVLDSVRVENAPDAPDAYWTNGTGDEPTLWSDYHHLNLFLPAPSVISWTVTLPANTRSAEFRTAVAMSQATAKSASADGAMIEISRQVQGAGSETLFRRHLDANEHNWQGIAVPLTAYAGQTFTLRLTAQHGMDSTNDWTVYRYPLIDVQLDDQAATVAAEPQLRRVPAPTPNDVSLAVDDPGRWIVSGMTPLPASVGQVPTFTIGDDPQLVNKQPMNLCIANYTHFVVQIAASPEITPRAMQIFYRLNEQAVFLPVRSIFIPLLADGTLHEYSYDLKLLGLRRGVQLTGLRIDPVGGAASAGANQLQIADMRFVRGTQPGGCEPDAIATSRDDLQFDLANGEQWQPNDLRPVPGAVGTRAWKVAADPTFTSRQPLDICLTEYSQLVLRVSASPDIVFRSLQLYYQMEGDSGLDETRSVTIPLFTDGELHDYRVDVRQFKTPSMSARLRTLRLDPVGKASAAGLNLVEIVDFRLLPSESPRGCAVPKLTDNDIRFDITDITLWTANAIQPSVSQGEPLVSWTVGNDPSFTYRWPLNVCLDDYTHLYLRLAASSAIKYRSAQIYYQLADQPGLDEARTINISLSGDEAMHDYYSGLQQLGLLVGARLIGLRLDPVGAAGAGGENWVRIADFRLIRGPDTGCGGPAR